MAGSARSPTPTPQGISRLWALLQRWSLQPRSERHERLSMPLRSVISARDDARKTTPARTSACKERAAARAPLRLSRTDSISPQFKGAISVGGGSSVGGRGSSGGGRCSTLGSGGLTQARLCTSASTQIGAKAGARNSAMANILLILQRWCRTHVRGTAFVSEACALCLTSLQVVKVAEDRLRAGLEDVLRRCVLLLWQQRIWHGTQRGSGSMLGRLAHRLRIVASPHSAAAAQHNAHPLFEISTSDRTHARERTMRFDTKMRATITMDGGVIFLREFAQRMRAGRWFVDATVFCQQNVYNLNYPAQKTYWTH